MKIGDKVRFLSEVGGGKVSGFQGKDIVLVEDEDGFDIPMPRSQVVVIDTDDYNIAKVNTRTPAKSALPSRNAAQEEQEEPDLADLPRTFKAKPLERRGGDLLNVYLAYAPRESKGENDQHFDAILVNDTNYYLQILYMTAENASWQCRFMGSIEPNSQQKVDAFLRSQLNEREHLCLQLMAYKQDKPFALKPAISVELRLDTVKFYKTHTFRQCNFFPEPVLLYDIVRDNQPRTAKF